MTIFAPRLRDRIGPALLVLALPLTFGGSSGMKRQIGISSWCVCIWDLSFTGVCGPLPIAN